jgi:MFS transporter, FHS family, L-fucose permease
MVDTYTSTALWVKVAAFMDRSHIPITERRFLLPFILITSLFFLWAIGVNLNDILIPHFKKAFALSDFQSSLIQSAFFGGYFLAALPAGWFMDRVGYKRGILTGLLFCAMGAVLFIPASMVRMYPFFLFALFVMACGQCFLEVAANPYITILGPPETAVRRLNLAQSFNAVGAVVTPFLGAAFILSGIEYTPAQIAGMSVQDVVAYRIGEANAVRIPYLVITAIFLFEALLIYLAKLPETHETKQAAAKSEQRGSLPQAWKRRHLAMGVIAQFFYVGAQVGVASFIIRFAEHTLPGTHEKTAAHYLQLHLLGFMIGRFAGSGIMKKISGSQLLAIFATGALLCLSLVILGSGQAAVWAIVLVGFFHSIMFPTIFALSLRDLGSLTKVGSSLLVMSIIGGAIVPAVMGRLSDAANIQAAFAVPLLCHLVVLYFALRGYRPVASPSAEVATSAA